jgi:phage-related protein
MVWLFDKIESGFDSVEHTIGNAVHEGYSSVKNVVSGAGHFVSQQSSNAYNTVNHVIQEGSNIISKGIDTGKSIITSTENRLTSVISTPLMLIAGGLGLFMVMNGKGITDTAQSAIQRI